MALPETFHNPSGLIDYMDRNGMRGAHQSLVLDEVAGVRDPTFFNQEYVVTDIALPDLLQVPPEYAAAVIQHNRPWGWGSEARSEARIEQELAVLAGRQALHGGIQMELYASEGAVRDRLGAHEVHARAIAALVARLQESPSGLSFRIIPAREVARLPIDLTRRSLTVFRNGGAYLADGWGILESEAPTRREADLTLIAASGVALDRGQSLDYLQELIPRTR